MYNIHCIYTYTFIKKKNRKSNLNKNELENKFSVNKIVTFL